MRTKLPYEVLMIDPPWRFGDNLPGLTRGATNNYETMTIQELCDYRLPSVADDAVAFLWRVAAIPDWLTVCRAWGFEPVSEVVWVKVGKHKSILPYEDPKWHVVLDGGVVAKVAFGMGRTVRNCHEVCVIAKRGRGLEVQNHSIRSVIFGQLREHSRKPDEIYDLAESMYPDAKRADVFSRQQRPGWDAFGYEVDRFKGSDSNGS